MLWYLLVLAGTNLLLAAFRSFGRLAEPMSDLAGGLGQAAVTIAFARPADLDLAVLYRRSGLGGWGVPRMVAAALVIYVFMLLNTRALIAFGFQPQRALSGYHAGGWQLSCAFIALCVIPATFEELGFRGVVMQRLQQVMSPRDTLLAQALLFSFAHMLPTMFISHSVIGLCLGYLRKTSGSLWPGMIVHGWWNALVLIGEL